MPGIHKVETSFVSDVPVADVHNLWSSNLPLLSTICPDVLHSVELVQGRWGKPGTVVAVNYKLDGKVMTVKEIIEVIDKKKNKIVFRVLEGEVLEYYKSFRVTFQASPDDNVVKWSLEYEKANEHAPDPTAYLDLVLSMNDKIDAHLNGH